MAHPTDPDHAIRGAMGGHDGVPRAGPRTRRQEAPGLDPTKVSQVPRWRETEGVYTELERDVMAYAEAMTATPPTVTDDMVAALVARLGSAATVELTEMVAVENLRSRSFSAAGVRSQGYSDVCELPLASS
ncbi:carboxymuconolactone decarboxylase family protein [Isoptericola sp. NPDC056573]|uniref:carboxymuconolactone decarboxylase family protein n=1 Tax=Isoptericola sp. NPDC056573 TaxID=3345868 RepID=UPI0036A68BAA